MRHIAKGDLVSTIIKIVQNCFLVCWVRTQDFRVCTIGSPWLNVAENFCNNKNEYKIILFLIKDNLRCTTHCIQHFECCRTFIIASINSNWCFQQDFYEIYLQTRLKTFFLIQNLIFSIEIPKLLNEWLLKHFWCSQKMKKAKWHSHTTYKVPAVQSYWNCLYLTNTSATCVLNDEDFF